MLHLFEMLTAFMLASLDVCDARYSCAVQAAVPIIVGAIISSVISIGISLLTAPNLKGPKQKDAGIQSSAYGSPIPIAYGPQVRMAGSVIWYSGLKEHKHKKSGSGGSQTTFTYTCSAAILLAEARFGRQYKGIRRVWANRKLIYSLDDEPIDEFGEVRNSKFGALRFYPGSATQEPDPTMEEALGVGNVPAYRYSCYVVIAGLQLLDFGPTLPNLEFELIADEQITVAECVQNIGAINGVNINVADIEQNTGNLAGYGVVQDGSGLDVLAAISSAYYFDIAEQGTTLRCTPRGMKSRVELSRDDFAAAAGDTPDDNPIHFERRAETDIPQEVAVTYNDYELDLQQGAARARYEAGNAQANITVGVPITLTNSQALAIAKRVLWGMRFTSLKATFRLSEKWIGLVPGNIVTIPTDLGLQPFLITKATRGADGVIQMEALYEDSKAYPESIYSVSDYVPPGTPSGPGPTTMVLLDIPILRDAHDSAGFYSYLSGTRPTWDSAVVYRSTDGGTDYTEVTDNLGASTIGTVVGAALPSGPTTVWDRANSLTVLLTDVNKEIETISELSCLNGNNVCYLGPANGVGGEIFQFQRATLVDVSTYLLTNLLRGQRGTEWAVGNHTTDDIFVLLNDSAEMVRLDYGPADWDRERLYKPVTARLTIDDTDPQSFTNTGEGKRCLSPVRLIARRDSSDNLRVGWIRRTRFLTSGLSGIAEIGEDVESYLLEFYPQTEVWTEGETITAGDWRRYPSAVDYGWAWYTAKSSHMASAITRPDGVSENWSNRWRRRSPIREVSLLDKSTYIYSAVEQTADGRTPGESFDIQVRQRSATRGLGHPALSPG